MTPADRERLVRIEAGVDELCRRRDDHEIRVRKLETRQYWFGGVFAAASAALTFMAGKIHF